jgi:hypothetical protein
MAWQCKCGYEFGQSADRVLELLRSQRVNLRIGLVIVLILDAAAVGAVIYSVMHGFLVFSMFGFIVLGLWTARLIHKLAVTRASLRQVNARELPKAIVRT